MYAFSTPTNTEMEAANFGFRNLVRLVQNTYFHDYETFYCNVCLYDSSLSVVEGGESIIKEFRSKNS
jgi:hypothetical protein